MFDGNDDSDTIVYNILNPPFTARYIRVVPVEWHTRISMRLEIYGCAGNLVISNMKQQNVEEDDKKVPKVNY